jgi:hypothetical protein
VSGLVFCGGSIGCHLCDGRVCDIATRARDACAVMGSTTGTWWEGVQLRATIAHSGNV